MAWLLAGGGGAAGAGAGTTAGAGAAAGAGAGAGTLSSLGSGISSGASSALGGFGHYLPAGTAGPTAPASGFLGGLSGQAGLGSGPGVAQNFGATLGQLANQRLSNMLGGGGGGGGGGYPGLMSTSMGQGQGQMGLSPQMLALRYMRQAAPIKSPVSSKERGV